MKRVLALVLLVFVGVGAWRIGSALDSDAVSMAVGVFFGVLAGVPAALLVLAARSREDRASEPVDGLPVRYDRNPYPAQPQIIVVTPAPYGTAPAESQAPAPYAGLLTDSTPPRRERRFKVVGEEEAWIED